MNDRFPPGQRVRFRLGPLTGMSGVIVLRPDGTRAVQLAARAAMEVQSL